MPESPPTHDRVDTSGLLPAREDKAAVALDEG
jgi:hypothetical protein